MDRVAHQSQGGVNNGARILRIEFLEQGGRPLDVGKQQGD